MVNDILIAAYRFPKRVIGVILRPYETYRKISSDGKPWELGFIAVCAVCYFATAAIVKTSLFRPFLLTRQFFALFSGAAATYIIAVGLFWTVGKLFGAKGTLRGLGISWGYTLLPTIVWFWVTSLLYVTVPPPRTTAPMGVAFSVLYLLFSATLLFWKVTLAYLSLRFALRLDLVKILATSAIVLSILAVYSVGMYWLGLFRVPFI